MLFQEETGQRERRKETFYNGVAERRRLRCGNDIPLSVHCPQPTGKPSTHGSASLEPASFREGPPGQDDTGQGHRLSLQDADGGGTAGDLWGCCETRRMSVTQA